MPTNTKTTVQERITARSGSAALDLAAAAYLDAVDNANSLARESYQSAVSPAQVAAVTATLNKTLDAARVTYNAALKAVGG